MTIQGQDWDLFVELYGNAYQQKKKSDLVKFRDFLEEKQFSNEEVENAIEEYHCNQGY